MLLRLTKHLAERKIRDSRGGRCRPGLAGALILIVLICACSTAPKSAAVGEGDKPEQTAMVSTMDGTSQLTRADSAGQMAQAQAKSRAVSIQDADQDGVVDAEDRCAATPIHHPVDAQGCELFSGSLKNVDFEPNSFMLSDAAREALDLLIKRMNEHALVVLSISGHTDNRGNARNNLELSKKRVLAVVRYLVLNGVDGRRLKPYGYGESRPLFSNATAEGRRRNRRIEVKVVGLGPG